MTGPNVVIGPWLTASSVLSPGFVSFGVAEPDPPQEAPVDEEEKED